MDRLVPFVPTPEQLEYYRGTSARQKYERLYESLSYGFLGMFASYWAAYVVGGPLATIAGTGFAFNGMLRPYVGTYIESVRLRAAGKGGEGTGGTSAALFRGEVLEWSREYVSRENLSDDFGEPSATYYEIALRVGDEDGRALTVRAPFDERFYDLQPGMLAAAVIFAEAGSEFTRLTGSTEVCVPALDLWIGSFPHLDRSQFRGLLRSVEGQGRRRR